MALFKLLFSILLLSLVYSAPVDLPAETTDGGQESAVTVSDTEKDAKSPTKTDDLTSSLVFTSSPTEQSDLSAENNEGESIKSNDPVPTDAAKEGQATSQPSSNAILLDGNVYPISHPGVIPESPENEKELQKESENIPKESNPEVDPPTSDNSQEEDVKSLDDDTREPTPTFDQKPEGVPVADSKPIPSVLEETSIPVEIADRDDTEPPQEPYDDRPLDLTPESFNEEATRDEANDPQIPIDAESTNEEKVIDQPFEFPPEDTAREIIQTDATEIQNEPENTEQINDDDIRAGSDPSQLEDQEPPEIVAQPEGGDFESDAGLPTPDQSDAAEEQENSNPGPPLSMTVEEMISDPVELPMREESEPPAILVRDDIAPPNLSVIHWEQQPPQFGPEEVVPLSDDSTKGETPEEEVSNPDNPSQEMLSFDNRPEQPGPMNIL